MEKLALEFFNDFPHYIVFLHAISMSLFIGVLFAMYVFVRPIIFKIKIPRVLYGTGIEFVKIFLIFATICLSIIIITGLLMCNGLGYKYGNPKISVIADTIKILWVFMCIGCIYTYKNYLESKKYFEQNEYIHIHENLQLVFSYVIPLNCAISIIAVYLSVFLRGYQ